MKATGGSGAPAERGPGSARLFDLEVQRQAEAVGQPGEVVEDPHDVGYLEATPVVHPQVPKRLPVIWGHPGGLLAQFLRDLAQRSLPFAQVQRAPLPRLDGFDQLGRSPLDTQKLCVRLRSVVAVLSGRGHPGDHLSLPAIEAAGGEHDLHEERAERLPDLWMGPQQTGHPGHEAEVIGPDLRRAGPHLFFRRELDPRLLQAHAAKDAIRPRVSDSDLVLLPAIADHHGTRSRGTLDPVPEPAMVTKDLARAEKACVHS